MYNASTTIMPFWAENGGFIRGRDPLGIQNSSITVYGRLLPGMTNLTGRIRYYSFYCWLLDEYDKLNFEESKTTPQAQYNFIRRAELIMAYLMVIKEPSITNVPGSNHATKYKSNNVYYINIGADKPVQNANKPVQNANKPVLDADNQKIKLYWDYESGALGQYYAGSLISLGLIEVIEKYFHIRPNGQKIADAFRSVVPANERIYFLKLIKERTCVWNDFNMIMSFRLNALTIESEEWRVLNDLLFEQDGENFITRDGNTSCKRVETIELYLRSKLYGISTDEFPLWIFNNISKDLDPNTAEFGWFYYYLNEAVHFALSSIFWAFLFNSEKQILNIEKYLKDFEAKILKEVMLNLGVNNETTIESTMDLIGTDYIPDELANISNALNKKNSYYAASKSVILLIMIYNFVKPYKEQIKRFELNNYVNCQKGNLSEHLSLYIEKNRELSYEECIDRIVKVLINDHMATAYRKMGNGDANLLKFLIEDMCIIHIETIEPRGTTPRIYSLRNFMLDLGYIDEEDNLTSLGEKLLNVL